jgi:hypothetical protein
LTKALLDFRPATETEKLLYPQMLQEGTQFWQNRNSRIGIAEKGVPAVEWLVLIVGAVTTVFFTYFFGMEDLRLQVVMTAMIGMLIALNLNVASLLRLSISGRSLRQNGRVSLGASIL